MYSPWLCGLVGSLLSLSVSAAIVDYSDRMAWRSASGTIVNTEDFESFGVDTPYSNVAPLVLASGMTLTSVSEGGSNIIDVPPHVNSESDVNGTASMRANNSSTPIILFDNPVSAWGADFSEFQDNQIRTTVEIYYEGSLITSIVPVDMQSPTIRFFGFAANAGEVFDEIRFVNSDASDTFGVDDIEIGAGASATSSIPVLDRGGLLTLATMLLLIGWIAVHRRTSQN
jgi:hypothetical protein